MRKILPALALAALVATCGLSLANAAAQDPPTPADSPPVDPALTLIQTR